MKSHIKKILEYLNKNKIYIISYLFFFVLLFLIMNQVTMYADDFELEMISKRSVGQLLQYQLHHYLNWGGGITPLFVTLLFKLGFNLWKILNCFLITTMFFMFAKLISKTEKKFLFNFSFIWCLFYFINIAIVRESIYWLDGSMAYVVATFEVFLMLYMLYTRFVINKEKKYDKVILPIIALLSGLSGAQTSAITLIVLLLFGFWYKFISHKKFNKKLLIYIIFGVVGSLVFFLSPGNSSRMETFAEFSKMGIIDKALYRISDVSSTTYSSELFTAVPIFIFAFSYLLLILNYKFYSNYNKKWKNLLGISILIQTLFLFVTLISRYANLPYLNHYLLDYQSIHKLNLTDLTKLIPYIFMVLFVISNFISVLYRKLDKKNMLLMLILISVYCSQFSMILAPYMPYRTCLTAILFLIFGIILLINYLNEEKIDYTIISPIIISYMNIQAAFIIWIIIMLINNLKIKELRKIIYIICVLPFVIISLNNYKDLLYNYSVNKKVYEENIKIIKNSRNIKDVIYIKRLSDDNYSFTQLAGHDWIENEIRVYYKLQKTVDIDFIDEGNN